MTEFIENIKNNPKTQKDVKLNVNNFSNQPNRTQTEIEQKAIIQRKIYEKAKEILIETIEDTDEEMEVEDNKINFKRTNQGFQMTKQYKKRCK